MATRRCQSGRRDTEKMDGHFEIVPSGKKQLQVGLLTRKETETLVRNLGSQYDTVC